MSGNAIAGTLASTRSLFGLSHVFPQSSILYGPRFCGNSSSALSGDARSVPAAPATAATTARRVMMSLVADMVRLLSASDMPLNAALSCHVPEVDERRLL